MLTPGFFDAHVHLIDAGIGLSSVQLQSVFALLCLPQTFSSDVTSKEAFVARIRDYALTKKPRQWILNGAS